MCIYCPHQLRWSVQFLLWHSRPVSANRSIPSSSSALPLRSGFLTFNSLSFSSSLRPSLPLTLSCSAGLLLHLQQAAPLFGAWLPPRVLEAAFSWSTLSRAVLSAELLHPVSRPPALQGSCSLGPVSLSGGLLALPRCWKGLHR